MAMWPSLRDIVVGARCNNRRRNARIAARVCEQAVGPAQEAHKRIEKYVCEEDALRDDALVGVG